jgi:hypothetical protein
MNYDSMSVHGLLGKYVEWGKESEYEDIENVQQGELALIESALRSAVIREASVGEISIEQHEGYMSPDPMFTVGTKSKLKAGEFYIVPKEKA